MTRFGVQNSVMGWNDPWHEQSCKTMMRTGEQMYFAAQDPTPDKKAYIKGIRENLGADFYVHYCIPKNEEISAFIDDMREFGMDYFLGNEFGNANKVYTPGTNRYDIPVDLVRKAISGGRFLGLFYDETEHLQMNNLIYQKDPTLFQWGNPIGKSLAETEADFVGSVKKLCDEAGCEVYSEVLFATLYHALLRGGMNLSPKSMKECKQSIQFATAMGAVKQYGRKMGITVDLWGPDVGDWFTRMWCFPGHSPKEFKNALWMSYWLGPDFMFVENIDALMRSRGDAMALTEFGEIYREFISKAKNTARPYDVHSCECDIAVVRSDDGVFCKYGTFYRGGPYGSPSLKNGKETNSWFDVMSILTHKTVGRDSTTMHAAEPMPATTFPRDPETLKGFPREHGAGAGSETRAHTLFYPMNKVLVFDDRVTEKDLLSAKLIIVCGSRLADQGRKSVYARAEAGAKVIMADWLYPEDKSNIESIDDFYSDKFAEMVAPYIGRKDEWRIGYRDYELLIANPEKDGISLEFEIINKL